MSSIPPSSDPDLRPDAIFAGKYRVVRELGRGAAAVVVEAEHVRLRQRVAIKILDARLVDDAAGVERFEREARAMAALKSPYVTSVLDVDALPDGTPYVVMDLLHGRDLSSELRERGRLPPAEALALAIQACEGLEIVHAAGLIHRDLKPSNLFLVPTDRGVLLKLTDVGIAHVDGDGASAPSSLGTPAYRSPEQASSPEDVDARTDLWSLGVILFHSLSGALPFDAGPGAARDDASTSLADRCPELPASVVAVVNRLLETNRDDRPPNATAVREALTVCASELGAPGGEPEVETPPASARAERPAISTMPPIPATRRLVTVAFVSGALTLMVGLVAALAVFELAREPSAPPIPPASAPIASEPPNEANPPASATGATSAAAAASVTTPLESDSARPLPAASVHAPPVRPRHPRPPTKPRRSSAPSASAPMPPLL
jgi:serine/threonine-protein kinase